MGAKRKETEQITVKSKALGLWWLSPISRNTFHAFNNLARPDNLAVVPTHHFDRVAFLLACILVEIAMRMSEIPDITV